MCLTCYASWIVAIKNTLLNTNDFHLHIISKQILEPFLFLESPCIEASSNDGDHCAAEVHASLIKHGSCTSSRAASQWLVQNSYRSGPTLKPCTMLSYTASVFSRWYQGDARLMHRGFYSGPRTIRILHEPLRCCAVACAWPMLYQCRM